MESRKGSVGEHGHGTRRIAPGCPSPEGLPTSARALGFPDS
jgi:hypothetical protein